MTRTDRWQLLRRSVTLTAVMMLGASLEAGAADKGPARGDLHGTWRVLVTPVSCSTGSPAGPPFRSMLSFADGTLSGTTLNAAFQPGQRTSDYGAWARTGSRTFEAVSEAFILFDSAPNPPVPAFQKGIHRITQTITLGGDRFHSVALSELFDADGELVMTLCATASATRLK